VDPEDLNGEGDVSDTHLRVIDTSLPVPLPPPRLLGPADDVAVHGGSVAFLEPEAAAGIDLNGDPDAADRVVHFWANRQVGAPLNLAQAAAEVALSDGWIAALVSEAGQGGGDLNGDADASDLVVHVNPVGTGTPGAWVNVGQAADSLDVVDDAVAFLTPEASQGADLDADGDTADRVLQVFDAATAMLTNVGESAEEFVLGERLVAFRTRECAEGGAVFGGCADGGTDLNGDGDAADDVLQVWDLETDQPVNSGQAVRPCDLEACDPRIPYRVSGDVVTFLTL
jgi:hypothetical protein